MDTPIIILVTLPLLGQFYREQGNLDAARLLYETGLQRLSAEPALEAALGALPR